MPDAKRPAQDVMSGLPAARPQRRSARRDGPRRARTSPAEVAAANQEAAAPGAAAARPATRPRKPPAQRAAQPKAAPRAARKQAPERKVPPAGYATPAPPKAAGDGHDPIAGAVQAVGDLAGKSLGLGTRALRGALSRLPRL